LERTAPDYFRIARAAYSFTTLYMVQDFEDAYIEEQTITREGNSFHLVVDSTQHDWIPSHILIYYDAYPEPISTDRIILYPYNGSYSFGDYVGGVVPKNYYLMKRARLSVEAGYWVTTQYNHEARFDLTPVFAEYGSGVYTLCIIEDNEFWSTICIYHSTG